MPKILKRQALFLILLCMAAILPSVAPAQKLLKEYKKPLPEIAAVPKAEFESKSTIYKDTPLGDLTLAHEFRLPADWTKSRERGITRDALNSPILTEIARFFGPPTGDLRSYFTIQTSNIEYWITAEMWVLQFMLSNSYHLIGMKTYGDREVEFLYVFNDKEDSYVVRCKAFVNGGRVVVAQYFMPDTRWDEEKHAQVSVIESTKMLHQIEPPKEKTKNYFFLDILQFDYPETWEIKADPVKNTDRLRIKMFNIASEEQINRVRYKALDAKIDISVVSRGVVESLKDEIRKFKSEIQRSGVILTNVMETHDDFKVTDLIQARPVEVYNTTDPESGFVQYELWLQVMSSGNFYYFVTLLTPSRDEDYFMWSRNVDTYKNLIASFEPQQGSIIEEE
jgi:hypothetical protein